MSQKTPTNLQSSALVILRILIGWHFLYEGIAKFLNPYWTSEGYLLESKGLFSFLFLWVAESPSVLKAVDFLNVWGLIAIGAALMAGCFTRAACISGTIILFFYYICNPPFVGYSYSVPAEGSYIVVNKILIEMVALFVLSVFPTGQIFGLDRLIYFTKKRA